MEELSLSCPKFLASEGQIVCDRKLLVRYKKKEMEKSPNI